MGNHQGNLKNLLCLIVLLFGGASYACNFSSLTLVSESSLGGGQYQFNLQMCAPGGCDGVDIFGTCIGSEMNDNTGNWCLGLGSGTFSSFPANLTSPQSGAVYSGALTSASSFACYSNATSWWAYEATTTVPTQQFCINFSIVTNGVPSDICVYGLEGADLIYLPPACPQVLGVTCIQPGPLEVEFIDFRADLEGDVVDLAWSTARERNHDRFLVEVSPDGGHYESVGEIKGEGESNSVKQYEFTHLSPNPGMNHYRITAVDMDGLSQHTNTIQVLYNPQGFKLDRIYPNPATDQSNLEFISSSEGVGKMAVFGLDGKQVLMKEIEFVAGRNLLQLEMSDWPPGVYSVLLMGESGNLKTKIVKR